MSVVCCNEIFNKNNLPGDCLVSPFRSTLWKTRQIFQPLRAPHLFKIFELVLKIIHLAGALVALGMTLVPLLIGLTCKTIAYNCCRPPGLPPSQAAAKPNIIKPPLNVSTPNPGKNNHQHFFESSEMKVKIAESDDELIAQLIGLDQRKQIKGEAAEDTFFDPLEGLFFKALEGQISTVRQLNNGITLALYILSLAESEQELLIAKKHILRYKNFKDLPIKQENFGVFDISKQVVELSIAVMEEITQKKFEDHFVFISNILFVKFANMRFHGTSVDALKGIKKKGLIVENQDREVQDDLKAISDICRKALRCDWHCKKHRRPDDCEYHSSIFKHHAFQTLGFSYITRSPGTGYFFGCRSPEFIASFFEKLCQELDLPDAHEETPFFAEKRNKSDALKILNRVIEKWLKEGRINGKDKDALLAFFHKYWEKYGQPSGAVLMMRRKDFRLESLTKEFNDISKVFHHSKQEVVQAHRGTSQVCAREFHFVTTPRFPNSARTCRERLAKMIQDNCGEYHDTDGIAIDYSIDPENIVCYTIPFVRIHNGKMDPYHIVD